MERRIMEKSKAMNTDRKGDNTDEIAYQNKDVASKVMAEEFEGKSFAVYGIDVPKIVKVEPTNLPAIEANELRMDNIFLLEDSTYAIVDYESEYRRENIFKYLGYVEYYSAAEPPVRCGVSHLSGPAEPPFLLL